MRSKCLIFYSSYVYSSKNIVSLPKDGKIAELEEYWSKENNILACSAVAIQQFSKSEITF